MGKCDPTLCRSIIHVDMDAFYASVEQRDNPKINGKPVVIGSDPKYGKGRGVVSAASYEARAYGIHSAQPISKAYRLCPHAVFLPVQSDRYVSVSREIMKIFHRYTPQVEAVSLDEAFLDMTGLTRLFGKAEDIGRRIKEEIRDLQHLTASVGVGPNKVLAKIASDLEKPDGFVVVSPEKIREFLNPLPVRRIWGVGRKMEEELIRLHVHTIGDLARFTQKDMKTMFGRNGESLWKLARGIDENPVIGNREAKSISNETTYEKDQDDESVLLNTLLWLAEKVSFRMRSRGVKGKTLVLKIRTDDFSTMTRNRTLQQPTDSGEIIYQAAIKLLLKISLNRPVRLLGIGMTHLSGGDEVQTNLFQDGRQDNVTRAVDRLRHKYGEEIIRKGGVSNKDSGGS